MDGLLYFREFFQYNNEKDIDIKPASGLKATRLLVADAGKEKLGMDIDYH